MSPIARSWSNLFASYKFTPDIYSCILCNGWEILCTDACMSLFVAVTVIHSHPVKYCHLIFSTSFHGCDDRMNSPEDTVYWRRSLSQWHFFSSTSWLQNSWREHSVEKKDSFALPLVFQYYYCISCSETEENKLLIKGTNGKVHSYVKHVRIVIDLSQPLGSPHPWRWVGLE